MKDLYVNVGDFQGTSFAIGRTGTIEEWREQALEWLDVDDYNEEYYNYLEHLDYDKVIDEINEMWGIEIIKCEMIKGESDK